MPTHAGLSRAQSNIGIQLFDSLSEAAPFFGEASLFLEPKRDETRLTRGLTIPEADTQAISLDIDKPSER